MSCCDSMCSMEPSSAFPWQFSICLGLLITASSACRWNMVLCWLSMVLLLAVVIGISAYIARALKRTNLFENLRGDMV